MSITGLEVFDRTIQETNIWLGEIAEDLVPDRQVAYRVLRVVLHAIRDGLTVDQAAHLSAQLPMLIRGICYEISPARTPNTVRSCAEFLNAAADDLGDTRPINPADACAAVFNCVRRHITPGQLQHVYWSLPEPVRQALGSIDATRGVACDVADL